MQRFNLIKTYAAYLLLVVFYFSSNTVSAQMRQVHLENADAALISSLSFYSPSEGYVAFRDWIGFTSDSGRTFTRKYITIPNVNYNGYNGVNLSFGFQILGVHAWSQNELIVYGSYGLVPAILRSTNGGDNFTLVFHSRYNSQQLRTGITDMIFPENGNVGYAVDADRILKTVNSGVSWTPIRIVPGSYYTNLEAVNNNIVVAMSDEGTNSVQKTINGGANWVDINPGNIVPSGSMQYTYFLNSNIGWMSITTVDKQYFYKTINGGINWNLQNNVAATGFQSYKFKFVDENTGYALSGLNKVFVTSDGGAIWEPLARDNSFQYYYNTHNDLQFMPPNLLWAGGGQGLLELNTNPANSFIPQAYFATDTSGAGTAVNLTNYSKTGYTYQWFVNNVAIGSSYNATYNHDIYLTFDTIKLIVSNGIYTDTTVKVQSFTAAPYPAPVITSFTPTSGTQGTQVTIQGDFFRGVRSVSFGGITAGSFTVQSLNTIVATVGAGANGAVSVTSARGTGSLTGFITTAPPVVHSFSPGSGPAGTIITVAGANFSNVPAENVVYVGGVKALVVAAASNQLTVIAPAGTGYLPISVTKSGHTAFSSLPFVMTFSATCNFNAFSLSADQSFDLVGGTNESIATADLNNDGKPDIVSGARSSIIVSKNISTTKQSLFAPGLNLATAGIYLTGKSVQIADINSDGRPDIVCTDGRDNLISIFPNTSTGTDLSFGTRVDIIAGISPQSITIQDFDLDGKPDIAYITRSIGNDSICFMRNISLGVNINFGTKQSFEVGTPVDLTSGDMDGDGKADLVFVPYSAGITLGSFQVYKNTSVPGIISFGPPISTEDISAPRNAIRLGDMDGDGKLDVVVTFDMRQNANTSGAISIYRNTSIGGNISFSLNRLSIPSQNYADLALGDLDGDAKPDIIAVNAYFKNTSTPGNIGMLNVGPVSNGVNGKLQIADINADGRADLVSGELQSTTVIVKLNDLGVRGAWAGNDTTICSGQQVKLGKYGYSNYPTGFQLRWTSAPAGFISTEFKPSVTPAVTTSYYVVVTNPQGCIMYDTIKVTIGGPLPAGPPITDTSGCTGDTLRINNPPVPGYTYSWYSSSYNYDYNSSVSNPSIPIREGVTYYTCETNTGYCINRERISILGSTIIPVNAGADKIICTGRSILIGTSNSSAYTYSWTASDAVYTSTASLASVRPTFTTSYYLKQTSTSSGCTGRDTVLVTVLPLPIANAGPDRTICGSDSIMIGSPAIDGLTYQWVNVENLTSISKNAMTNVRPAVNTRYYVRVSNAGCNLTDTTMVTVYPGIPTLNITASDTSICLSAGTNVQFSGNLAGSGIFTYQWKKNNMDVAEGGTTYNSNNIQHEDTVMLVATGNIGCSSPSVISSNKLIIRIENRWVGPLGGSWNSAANWNCLVVPDGSTNVTIPAGSSVVVHSLALCRSLRILPGSMLDILPSIPFIITH